MTTCIYCKKSVSFFTLDYFNVCNSCREAILKHEKEERTKKLQEEFKEKINAYIHIFKTDEDKMYKTLALLAYTNGIFFDDENRVCMIKDANICNR